MRLLISAKKVDVIHEVKAVAADKAKAIQPSSKLTSGIRAIRCMARYLWPEDMVITTQQAAKDGMVPLHYPMLTPTNYSTWAIKMEANMDARGVWEVIKLAAGVVMDVRKDKMARACIFQAVAEDILLLITKKKSAKEAWESIKTQFLGVDRVKKARVQTLKSEFETLRMKETDSIDEFAGRISGLANKFSELGATMDDATLTKKLFGSTPNRFL